MKEKVSRRSIFLVYQWNSMSSPSESLRSKAFHYLQQKLLSGAWSSGEVISEQSLAAELGMSRTPVREAIRQLEQEGVLEQLPRFGTRLKPLSRADLIELYQLREAIEPYAVFQAAGQVSMENQSILHKLCANWKEIADEIRESGALVANPEQMKKFMRVDLAFHQVLIRSSGNRRMMKIVADSRLLAGIFMTERQEHTLEVIDATLCDHEEILQAVLLGKGEAARQSMAKHIRVSLVSALQHFDQASRQMPSQNTEYPGDNLLDLALLDSMKAKEP